MIVSARLYLRAIRPCANRTSTSSTRGIDPIVELSDLEARRAHQNWRGRITPPPHERGLRREIHGIERETPGKGYGKRATATNNTGIESTKYVLATSMLNCVH